MPPTVSVIMAAYNEEDYLDEGIQSILDQTFSDFELIIINDNSTDKTQEIAQQYVKKDERVTLINNNNNQGPAGSRNRGINNSSGKYIAVQDADDVALPERLEKQVNVLEENDDLFLCATDAIHIDEDGNVLGQTSGNYSPAELKKQLPQGNCITHSTVMFRNTGIQYREKLRYSHDYDLYLRILSKGHTMKKLDKALIKLRLHRNSVGMSETTSQELFSEKARQFYRQRQETGQDSYDEFTPEKILEKGSSNPEKNLIQRKIMLALQNDNYNKAADELENYIALDNVSILESMKYRLCISFPPLYKLYHRLRYGPR